SGAVSCGASEVSGTRVGSEASAVGGASVGASSVGAGGVVLGGGLVGGAVVGGAYVAVAVGRGNGEGVGGVSTSASRESDAVSETGSPGVTTACTRSEPTPRGRWRRTS